VGHEGEFLEHRSSREARGHRRCMPQREREREGAKIEGECADGGERVQGEGVCKCVRGLGEGWVRLGPKLWRFGRDDECTR
jgi:hypothetical protein